MILAGRQAIDGDTAQVGPQIAEKLGLPQVTYVEGLKIDGKKLIVQRQLEDGYETIELQMPALLTAVKELNEPGYLYVDKIFDCFDAKIHTLTINDVAISTDSVGLKASPTRVKRTFTPLVKSEGEMLQGTEKEMAARIVSEFKQMHFI